MPDFPEHDPQIERAKVKRFMIAGHGNLEAVKEMLAEEPGRINGAIDWGKGDSRRPWAAPRTWGDGTSRSLLERNARLDIFAAAMLGKLDIVRPRSRHSRTS